MHATLQMNAITTNFLARNLKSIIFDQKECIRLMWGSQQKQHYSQFYVLTSPTIIYPITGDYSESQTFIKHAFCVRDQSMQII